VLSRNPLDNPVWHALTGPQATVAEGAEAARRFLPTIAPFAAFPDELARGSWPELRTLVTTDEFAVIFRAGLEVPDDWDAFMRVGAVQMVAVSEPNDEQRAAAQQTAATLTLRALTAADVPAMLELVALTRPGPFKDRTIELGRYIGIEIDGALAAMAGERMRLPDYVEMSAICTRPEHRGKGFASVLVIELFDHITGSGCTPILHAVTDNFNAIKLYEQLGFETRTTTDVVGVRPRS